MATKKKAAKPAKKTATVKKIVPAKKTASKSAQSSGSGKSAKKAPVTKSIAKPVAKKVAASKIAHPVPATKKSMPVPTKKPAVSNISKPVAPSVAKTPPAAVKSPNPNSTASGTASKAPVAQAAAKQVVATPPPPPPVAVAPPKVEPKKPVAPPKPVKVVIPEMKTKTVRKYEPEFTKSVLDTPQEEQTGPTMRYSDAELTEFRELINRKLDAAKKELAYLQGLITRKDEMGGDNDDARYMTMEDGSMSMEREQLSQMASRQITFIDHLEKAIMRIENKTYGICRVTGKLIDKARLRAVPHATLSIEAKQMMNK
ncbi:MAG TPA: TraR/DksA C4-type zinc finger protein [Puia sp.]|jgi:RNA polymerase-binding transcription factor DksA